MRKLSVYDGPACFVSSVTASVHNNLNNVFSTNLSDDTADLFCKVCSILPPSFCHVVCRVNRLYNHSTFSSNKHKMCYRSSMPAGRGCSEPESGQRPRADSMAATAAPGHSQDRATRSLRGMEGSSDSANVTESSFLRFSQVFSVQVSSQVSQIFSGFAWPIATADQPAPLMARRGGTLQKSIIHLNQVEMRLISIYSIKE